VYAQPRQAQTILESGELRPSDSFCGRDAVAAPFAHPLPEPRAPVRGLPFDVADLLAVRRLVAGRARAAGLSAARREDLVLAVNEIVTNSIRHGGGRGTLRVWREADVLICEVRDSGHLDDPLAGRRRPRSSGPPAAGSPIANQVCDLVQLRSYPHGCAVRLHMRTP
jgi:anti-sigma regulatory factor (Ser/Thr protein kinase)